MTVPISLVADQRDSPACQSGKHKWERARDIPDKPVQGKYGTWWFEHYRCSVCGAVGTGPLVASQEG